MNICTIGRYFECIFLQNNCRTQRVEGTTSTKVADVGFSGYREGPGSRPPERRDKGIERTIKGTVQCLDCVFGCFDCSS